MDFPHDGDLVGVNRPNQLISFELGSSKLILNPYEDYG